MERLTATLNALLALLIIVGIVLGPLGFESVHFHMNRNSIVQYEGSEVAMLVVAIGLFISAWLWLSNVQTAAAISLGLALFVIYTMVTVVMGQEYQQFPEGNAEKFFLLYAAITALAGIVVLLGVNALQGSTLNVSSRWMSITKWTLGVQAGLFALMWLAQITNVYRNGFSTELGETRLLFWLVKYLDLGYVIPAAFLTLALLHHHQPLASTLVLAVAGFTTVMLVTIAAMTISSWLQDEPEGVLVLAAGMLVLAIPSALVWWQWANAAHTNQVLK